MYVSELALMFTIDVNELQTQHPSIQSCDEHTRCIDYARNIDALSGGSTVPILPRDMRVL